MHESLTSQDRHGNRQPGEVEIVVVGYAGIDFVWQASASPGPGRTALLSGPVNPRPRFGGCGPAVALELARMGRSVALISWLGEDGYGREYAAQLQEAGVDTTGLIVAAGELTPRTFLFYDPEGGATVCFHPSGSQQQTLDAPSRARLASARALALTVCPAALTSELLEVRPPEAILAWDVKADADAYPPPLRRRLLAEADIVCLNRDELAFLAEPGRDAPRAASGTSDADVVTSAAHGVVVVTAGAAGIFVSWPEGQAVVRPERVSVEDPTGAGDAFFAAFLAATLRGDGPEQAARVAAEHVVGALSRAAEKGGKQ